MYAGCLWEWSKHSAARTDSRTQPTTAYMQSTEAFCCLCRPAWLATCIMPTALADAKHECCSAVQIACCACVWLQVCVVCVLFRLSNIRILTVNVGNIGMSTCMIEYSQTGRKGSKKNAYFKNKIDFNQLLCISPIQKNI